jgi:hypothetical protein
MKLKPLLTRHAHPDAGHRVAPSLRNVVSARFTVSQALPCPVSPPSGGLNVQLVQQIFLLLNLIEFVGHDVSCSVSSGHATAHPFSRFRARVITTDC